MVRDYGFHYGKGAGEKMKKLKVLVSAYACEPHKGSEPGVGWNWAKQIAHSHEVWVVTRTNNRQAIEEELIKNPDPNLHFIYVDLPVWMSTWKKGQRGVRTYYYLWQAAALAKMLRYKNLRFDVSHHVTFVNDWLPSFLAFLPFPFIWGPVGSHAPIPQSFLPGFRFLFLDKLRLGIQYAVRLIDPFYYVTLLRAKKIVLISESINKNYPFYLIPSRKKIMQPAIGIDSSDQQTCRRGKPNTIQVVSVGRLIQLKGFTMTLKAFAQAQRQGFDARLGIIGEGEDRKYLEALAASENISDSVHFLGNIDRQSVLKEMASADIFLFPSFEGGGMVVLEAMAACLPVVCLDYGGPGEMITPECGMKVAPLHPDQATDDLAEALCVLMEDPDLRKRMGNAGRKRAEDVYSWETKGFFSSNLYAECTEPEEKEGRLISEVH